MSINFFRGLRFAIPLGLIGWALIIALALTVRAHADEPTPKLEWAYQAVPAADMLTTLDIAKHPQQFQETNALLGTHPSQGAVVGYFAAIGGLHYLITRELVNENVPAPIVTAWECVTIGVESAYVGHNYSIGLRMKF